jgi:hypothetical protein
MRRGTRLHTNQAGSLFLEKGQNLTASQLAAHNYATRPINAMHLKNVLRKINTNRSNFNHGRLLIPRGYRKSQLWHIAMPLEGSRPPHQ